MSVVNRETGEITDAYSDNGLPEAAIRIDDVVIGHRARRDLGDLTDLMDSIREHGVLQPVGVMPDKTLLHGGRRLEACRRLGRETVPYIITRTRNDALSMLRAERDENTCRKDMTPEELVDLGLQIEELEAPKAQERQGEGQRAGGFARHGSASSPPGLEAEKPETTRTAGVVGEALGISKSHYKRAKHVVQTARGDNDPTPEVQQVASEALADMNAGTTTVTAAEKRVRQARKPQDDPTPEKPKPPPRHGTHGTRRKHREVIAALNTSLYGLALAAKEITELDQTVTAEEAARLRGDLSEHLKALNDLNKLLKECTK